MLGGSDSESEDEESSAGVDGVQTAMATHEAVRKHDASESACQEVAAKPEPERAAPSYPAPDPATAASMVGPSGEQGAAAAVPLAQKREKVARKKARAKAAIAMKRIDVGGS